MRCSMMRSQSKKEKLYNYKICSILRNNDYIFIFDLKTLIRIFNKIQVQYRPEVIVMQCGADSLYGDPIDSNSAFNLTLDGYLRCVKLVVDKNVPTIFLGGGGYNFANTSRLWCSITSLLVNTQAKLSNDIPEHEYFLDYSPDYELNINKGVIKNKNNQAFINSLVNRIIENLNNINF